MPADELLDDLVWILLHREHIPGIPLDHIERFAEEIYGEETKEGKNDGIDEEYLTVFQTMQRKYPDISLDKQLDYLEALRKRSWELCNGDLPQNENKLRQILEEAIKGIVSSNGVVEKFSF